MQFKFNPAQLSGPQLNNLMDVLGVIQSENQNELEITPVEFPLKLKVKLDDDVEMLLGWNLESDSYSGISMPKDLEPESPNKPKAGSIKPFELPKTESSPEAQDRISSVKEPEPKPEPEPMEKMSPKDFAESMFALIDVFLAFPREQKIEAIKEHQKLCIEFYKE